MRNYEAKPLAPVILAALRAEDYIDLSNHPGDEEQYEELAERIEVAILASCEGLRLETNFDLDWFDYRVRAAETGEILCQHEGERIRQ